MKLPTITARTRFGKLLREMKLVGQAVEIGVAEGGFSFPLLDSWPGDLHMIDCWTNQSQAEYRDSFNTGDKEHEARYQMVLKAADKYHGRAIVHRLFSVDGALLFANHQLDFVYIDANHRYENIREDLELWWPKVQPFGILAGHDYLDGELPTGSYGVKQAVTEFAARAKKTVHVIPEEWPSWWIYKGETK